VKPLFSYPTLWMIFGFSILQGLENEKKFKCEEKGKNPGIENLEISKFSIPKGLSFLKFEVSLRCLRGFVRHPWPSKGFLSLWYPLFF
jgi:hypothetical protein